MLRAASEVRFSLSEIQIISLTKSKSFFEANAVLVGRWPVVWKLLVVQRRAWFRLFLRLGVLGLGSAFVDSDGAEFLDGWLGFAGRLREKLAGLGAEFLGRPLLDR